MKIIDIDVDPVALEPAFPFVLPPSGAGGNWESGLTKRELFAAMAMQGQLSGEPEPHLNTDRLAQSCVEHADALIKALHEKR